MFRVSHTTPCPFLLRCSRVPLYPGQSVDFVGVVISTVQEQLALVASAPMSFSYNAIRLGRRYMAGSASLGPPDTLATDASLLVGIYAQATVRPSRSCLPSFLGRTQFPSARSTAKKSSYRFPSSDERNTGTRGAARPCALCGSRRRRHGRRC